MTRTAIPKDQIREYLAVAGSSTAACIAAHFKCSETQIHAKADQMVEAGLLECTKLPTQVHKTNGDVYNRNAFKAYRIRVKPPVATPETKLTVQGTPGTKSDAEGTLITAPTSGELRFTFPEPVKKDTSINTAIAAIATLRRTLTPDQLSALGVTLADPLADALEEISGEGGFDNFNHQAYRLRSALADKGLEIVERGSHDT